MKIICEEDCSVKQSTGRGWNLVTGLLLLVMPKCALCWAAYMSLFSSLGLVIKYQTWFLPVSLILFLLTLVKLLVQSFRKGSFLAFILAALAGSIIISQRAEPGIDGLKILAMLMMTGAVLMDRLINLFQALQFVIRSKEKLKN